MTTIEPVQTGYVPIGDLRVYYEVHGEGGTPLLLLHGGLFDIEQQFGALLPGLSAGPSGDRARLPGARAHERHRSPADHCRARRPTSSRSCRTSGSRRSTCSGSASAGPWRSSSRSTIPTLVRKVIVSSTSFARDGDRGGNAEAVAEMTVDMIAGTPMEQVYLAKSPHPDHEHLQTPAGQARRHLERLPNGATTRSARSPPRR